MAERDRDDGGADHAGRADPPGDAAELPDALVAPGRSGVQVFGHGAAFLWSVAPAMCLLLSTAVGGPATPVYLREHARIHAGQGCLPQAPAPDRGSGTRPAADGRGGHLLR